MHGSHFVGEVMTVTVADDMTSHDHYIHKAVLEKKSPYFAALSSFKEGEENHVVLQETDETAFKHVVHWLYTDRFSLNFGDSETTMMKTYALVDRLMMPRCMNMVIDNLRAKYTHTQARISDLATVKHLGYSASSNIAKCVIDQIVYEAITNIQWSIAEEDEAIFLEGGDLALEFTRKLVEKSRLYSLTGDGKSVWGREDHMDPATAKGCIYHEHAEGEKCYLQEVQEATK